MSNVAFQSLRGLALVTPFIIHLTIADLLISLLLPASFFLPEWSYLLSSQIAAGVWSHIQNIFEHWNGAEIKHSYDGFQHGSDHAAALPTKIIGEPALVLSNHVSWTDFYLLQSLALSTNPQMLPYQRYFAKSSLRYVPLLGWGLWALRMPLVSRRWTDDQAEIQRVFRGPRERDEPIWLVMFSEGTRWTARKWEQGVAWARSKGKPEPGKYVLPPRSKGFVAAVNGLREKGVSCVVDVTLAYARSGKGADWEFMKAPNMWATISMPDLSKKHAFWIHAERIDVRTLPSGDKELERWLEDRWARKARRLEELGRKIVAKADVHSLEL